MIRKCKICPEWHDVDEPWPQSCVGHFAPKHSGPQVIKDIGAYISVAAEKKTGKPVYVGGRAQHREFLRRNGYTEVGNDSSLYKQPAPRQIDTASKIDIRRAMEQVRSRNS